MTHELILVVDDDEDICELLKIFLESDGYRVNVAGNGLEAWEQIRAGEPPALILLDLMMARMDGEHFLQRLRSSGLANTNVILLSGSSKVQEKAQELKADAYLLKPVEFDELLTTVKRVVTPG